MAYNKPKRFVGVWDTESATPAGVVYGLTEDSAIAFCAELGSDWEPRLVTSDTASAIVYNVNVETFSFYAIYNTVWKTGFVPVRTAGTSTRFYFMLVATDNLKLYRSNANSNYVPQLYSQAANSFDYILGEEALLIFESGASPANCIIVDDGTAHWLSLAASSKYAWHVFRAKKANPAGQSAGSLASALNSVYSNQQGQPISMVRDYCGNYVERCGYYICVGHPSIGQHDLFADENGDVYFITSYASNTPNTIIPIIKVGTL